MSIYDITVKYCGQKHLAVFLFNIFNLIGMFLGQATYTLKNRI